MRRKKHFADYIVYISIAAVTLFTAAGIVLQFVKGTEISAQLTLCWFGFWTTEIISLATIKNVKTKNSVNKYSSGAVPDTDPQKMRGE